MKCVDNESLLHAESFHESWLQASVQLLDTCRTKIRTQKRKIFKHLAAAGTVFEIAPPEPMGLVKVSVAAMAFLEVKVNCILQGIAEGSQQSQTDLNGHSWPWARKMMSISQHANEAAANNEVIMVHGVNLCSPPPTSDMNRIAKELKKCSSASAGEQNVIDDVGSDPEFDDSDEWNRHPYVYSIGNGVPQVLCYGVVV